MIESADHRDRTLVLRIIGALLLLTGAVAAVLGPLEMVCFYLFSEGGPFYYEGFGFGSFMFAFIAAQTAGYYVLAAVLIPLGRAHLALRRWARPFSVALAWSWLVLGVPMSVVLLVALSVKDLTPAGGLAVLALLALSYLALPWLVIRFYRGQNVRMTFEAADPGHCRVEEIPTPVLVLAVLFPFYAIALHALIMLNGLFPLFGTFASGMPGIALLDAAILGLALLTWGVLRLRPWAWWGSLAWFVLLSTSTILTLCRAAPDDILAALNLPPAEMEILANVAAHGGALAALTGAPLLATLAVIVLSRRHLGVGS